jgi:hypothetical protein
MSPDAVPFVAAIVAMFAIFMVVLGGTALWTRLPDRKHSSRDRRSMQTGSLSASRGHH